jgi:hypothetical protein
VIRKEKGHGLNHPQRSDTVSRPDGMVAPHVKVLSDQVTVNSLDNGSLRLKNDDSLPNLRVGDVVIGASLSLKN